MEDYEQLDYDEEELKSALKKAQQIKKLGKEKPIAFLSDATKETTFEKLQAPAFFQLYLLTIRPVISFHKCRGQRHIVQEVLRSRQLQQQTTSQSGLNWDLMVDEFVKKTISVRTRRYAKSRSRSSSTGTSLSRHRRSRSVTRSSNSRPSSNASTPSPKKSRKKSNSPGRKDFKAKSSSQTKAQTKHSKQTIECAKAIGLGNEYLKQIEEQQKLRDEIARRKSQHRKEIYARDRDELKKNETSSTGAEGLQSKRDECERVRRQKLTTNKLRPYLAVVVTNLSGVEDFRKIALIAGKIGQVKKVWQENESNVYLIFEKHEDAKKFMQQYIGNSTVFGRVIDVSMKKVFLNTATFVQNSTDS
uniref:RRM domain-containing protein n=1 Tax=Globodera pallida TaxID=36090 RepID=A0A183BIJ6_GLOPA